MRSGGGDVNDKDALEQMVIEIGQRYGWSIENRGDVSEKPNQWSSYQLPWVARHPSLPRPIYGQTRADVAEVVAHWILHNVEETTP